MSNKNYQVKYYSYNNLYDIVSQKFYNYVYENNSKINVNNMTLDFGLSEKVQYNI